MAASEIKSMFNRKGKIVLLSVIGLTVVYWFLALWYTNKVGYTKDLVVFNLIFGPAFNNNPWIDFWQYIFQFSMTVVLFFFIPFLIVKYSFKEDFRDYGLRAGNKKMGIILTILLVIGVVIMAFFTSQEAWIQSEYPLSKLVGENWLIFVYYEAMYFFYFYAYEVIMRGYLQWGLLKENTKIKGIIVILILQTAISTLFHIGKPIEEITTALVFGPILGYAAIKLDSIWYGMIIHFVMNVFMDIFILLWLGMLPA